MTDHTSNAIVMGVVEDLSLLKTFAGKWKLSKTENFEAVLEAMGLNFLMRKMIRLITPTQDITVAEDGTVEIKLHSGPVTQDMSFKLEEESEYDQRGYMIKIFVRREGDKLIMEQTPDPKSGLKPQTMTREITEEGELLQTIQCGAAVAKRYFVRIPN